MSPSPQKPRTRSKRGVVAVILRDQRMLVIRRSQTVSAPGKLCLPGGTIEEGESEEQALVREMQEELNVDVTPIKLAWRSVTPWGTNLAWWFSHLSHDQNPVANPEEVADVFWMERHQLRTVPDALPSMDEFMDAWEGGRVDVEADWA